MLARAVSPMGQTLKSAVAGARPTALLQAASFANGIARPQFATPVNLYTLAPPRLQPINSAAVLSCDRASISGIPAEVLPMALSIPSSAPVQDAAPAAAKKPAFSGDWDDYRTLGMKCDPMASEEGEAMVEELKERGLTHSEAIDEAAKLLLTGSSMPVKQVLCVGDKLYKVTAAGKNVGPNSPFWGTKEEVEALKGMSYDDVARRLAIPLDSQQGTKFVVYEITAEKTATVFESVIAATEEKGANGIIWKQNGGGKQTLVTNRTQFGPPIISTITLP